MAKTPIHICLSADNNYAQHLAVVMVSIIKNLSLNYQAHFYVLDGGITDDNKQKIAELQKIKSFEILYLDMAKYDFSNCHCNLVNTTTATYFRLRIPSLLPHFDKVIYIDVDTVVDGDLSQMWQIDIGDALVGAVYELLNDNAYCKTLGIDDALYFNAGVLLMNLAQMRQQNCEAKFFDYIEHGPKPLMYDDQDVLNHVCHGQVAWLSPRFNLLNCYCVKQIKPVDFSASPYTQQRLSQMVKDPIVIHYNGSKKPWHYFCKHDLTYKYKKYLKLTPWKDFKYSDKDFKTVLKKTEYLFKRELNYALKKIRQKA